MELCILVEAGPYAGRRAVLNGVEIVIGRDASCNVPLVDDPQTSRTHAKIYQASGCWYIVDLGSTNGTRLNGQRIGAAPVPLTEGSLIEIGASGFRVESLGSVVPTPPPLQPSPPPAQPPMRSSQAAQPLPAKRPWGRALKEALAVYDRGIRDVVRDGVITPEEVQELWRVQARLGLTEQDTRDMRAQAFAYVSDQAIQNQRTDLLEANAGLIESLGFQGLGHPLVLDTLHRIVAYHQLDVIAEGQLPYVEDSELNLYDDEVSHLELGASLLEERVVNSGWVSGHSGVSFRVAKGVRFHVGGTRGHRVSERAVVPVSQGILAITSERIAFLGNPKSFEARWPKIMGIEPYSDGMTIFIANRVKAPTVQYESTYEAEVVAAICSAYIS